MEQTQLLLLVLDHRVRVRQEVQPSHRQNSRVRVQEARNEGLASVPLEGGVGDASSHSQHDKAVGAAVDGVPADYGEHGADYHEEAGEHLEDEGEVVGAGGEGGLERPEAQVPEFGVDISCYGEAPVGKGDVIGNVSVRHFMGKGRGRGRELEEEEEEEEVLERRESGEGGVGDY